MLQSYFERDGKKVLLTKEPGSPHDSVCVQIRSLLLNPENKISNKAAMLLFLADRAQHIELIKNKLSEGYIVISDRSSLSTFVYHAAAENKSHTEVAEDIGSMLDFAQEIQPNVSFICTAEYDWSMEQLKKRAKLDRIEQFKGNFHKRTHEFFTEKIIAEISPWIKLLPKKIITVPPSSSNPPEALLEYMVDRLKFIKG